MHAFKIGSLLSSNSVDGMASKTLELAADLRRMESGRRYTIALDIPSLPANPFYDEVSLRNICLLDLEFRPSAVNTRLIDMKLDSR